MVMLGTFFPWKARTLVVRPDMFVFPSDGGNGICRCSCCRSFVVVIFVNSPATISMISVTGIAEISYFGVASLPSALYSDARFVKNSSVAKLWICARSRTFIVPPSCLNASSVDHTGRGGGLVEFAGEASTGPSCCGV
jgi:hypothetical protein